MIIGITGPICSGKGKVAELFKEKGFVHHSFSNAIRKVAKERGIEINRQNLERLGGELRQESKESALGRRLLDMIEKDIASGKRRFVIEGIRDPDEIDLFRKHEFEGKVKRFVLIAVDAPQKVRWERMKHRNRRGDPASFDEFKKIDNRESAGTLGQEVSRCMKMADYLIPNDSGLKELEQKVESISREIA